MRFGGGGGSPQLATWPPRVTMSSPPIRRIRFPKLVYEHQWSLLIKKALGSSKLPPLAEWVILKLCDSFPTITHNFKGYTKMTDDKERSIMGHIFLWAAGARSHFIFIFQMTFSSFGSFARREAGGIILPPMFLSMFFFFFNYLLCH